MTGIRDDVKLNQALMVRRKVPALIHAECCTNEIKNEINLNHMRETMSEPSGINEPYLDPQMRPILEKMLERMAARTSMLEVTPEQMRVRASEDLARWNQNPPSLPKVINTSVPGAFGPVDIRIYDPRGTGQPMPALIYFHGGGWIIGDLETEDQSLRKLALGSGVGIVSVKYALAPEHKFPEPVEDCMAVSRWLRTEGEGMGLDTNRLGLGGGSAGANLAMATALSLRDAGDNWVQFLQFFYGVFSSDTNTESYRQYGTGAYGLDKKAMDFFLSLYLNHSTEKAHPLVSPLMADLKGLPPVFLTIAGADPLRDDSRMMADHLKRADVSVEAIEYPGVLHGFTLMADEVDAAKKAWDDAASALKQALGNA